MAPIGKWDYDTAMDTWGTKWDVAIEELKVIDNGDGRAQIIGWGESAWAPPIEAFQNYVNANPDVYAEVKYFEPGMSFIGVWNSEGGDACWDDVGTLLGTTEEEDDVLYELLEHFSAWDWYDSNDDEEDETVGI